MVNINFDLKALQADPIILVGTILATIAVFFDLVGSAMVDNSNNAAGANVTLGVVWWYFTTYVITLILAILTAAGNASFAHLQLVFMTLSMAYMPSDIDIGITSCKGLVRIWPVVQTSGPLKNLYNGMALRSAGLIILAIVWLITIIHLTVNSGKVAPTAKSPKKETV